MISGEHSIGITKLGFLEAAEVQSFVDYKQRVDPEGRFNKGKLMPGGDLRNAYTPSFALIGHESLIMEQSEIGRIADFGERLSALRQVQARMFDPRAARQSAL